jgi:glutamate 5-kinase
LTTAAAGSTARLDALVDAVAAGSDADRRSCWCLRVPSPRVCAARIPRRAAGPGAPQQAAASVGSSCSPSATPASFARHRLTVGQILLTSDDVVRRAHYRNAQRTSASCCRSGRPVVNENDTVATAEIRFGDNDRLAALVAHLVAPAR